VTCGSIIQSTNQINLFNRINPLQTVNCRLMTADCPLNNVSAFTSGGAGNRTRVRNSDLHDFSVRSFLLSLTAGRTKNKPPAASLKVFSS